MAKRGTRLRSLGLRYTSRFVALACAISIAGTASVAMAAATRIERGAETITAGTNNGEEGYWVEYDEYTYEEALAIFNDLAASLSDEDRKAAEAELKKLGKSPTLDELKGLIDKYSFKPLRDLYTSVFGKAPSNSSLNALKKKIADGQLTLEQVKKYLLEMKGLIDLGGTPAYGGGRTLYVSSIDKALGTTSWGPSWRDKKSWLGVANQVTSTTYTRYYNTASSFVEAGRLARMIELFDLGLVEPGVTTEGGHYAFGRWQGYSALPVTRDALLKELKNVYQLGIDTGSPIALDLNHDGKIGVTGKSTAAIRNAGNDFVKERSVTFDLRGLGRKERIEWLNRDGDGFLVLDVDGAVTKAAAAGKDIDGHQLFGNVRGYDHGFEKLALQTAGIRMASVDPRLDKATLEAAMGRKAASGRDLAPLKVWVDSNGDAKVQAGELSSLESLGITEVGLQPEFKTNGQGETIIVSYYVQNGKRYMAEDVWFAIEPAGGAR